MIILEPKLHVPNRTPYLIRNRLFSFIENHLDRSLICLTSDGGYGKTTLISSFIREKHIPAIWYQLSHQDRHLHTFLSYMKTAISRKISGKKMVYEIEPVRTDEEIENIIAILSTWPTRLIIILDHYQSIHQYEEVENVLARMIANASPLITFIIAGRTRPNLQLERLEMQNRMAELSTNDLAFTKEEISQFFIHLHDLTLHEHEIDLIFHKTEGWAAGLWLLQDAIKEMDETERSSFLLKFNGTPDIYDYLRTEILASQSDEIRAFLYQTCLLTDLDPDVINQFLGIDHSAEILEHLLDNHMFIYRTNPGTMKYHNLFRSFLNQELSKRYNQAEIDDFHKKLSLIHEQKFDFINAFAHSVVAGDSLNAAKLMKRMKERFDHSQFFALIEKLSAYFSPDISSADVSLFLFRCMPPDIIQDLTASLETHFKGNKEKQNPVLLPHFQHQLATIYFYLGEMNTSEQLCDHSLHESMRLKDDEMISKNLSLKSLIYWNMGKYEESAQFAQELLSCPVTVRNYLSHYLALWILAEINLEQNHIGKAESLLKETFKLSELRFDCSIIYHYCSMGKYYRLLGKHQEAFDWIRKAEELAVKSNLEFDLGVIYAELAQTYLETGQWRKAENFLSKAGDCLTHNVYLTCKIKQLKIKLWKLMGKHQLAAEAQKELEHICKEKSFYWLLPETNSESRRTVVVEDQKVAKLSIHALGKFEIKSEDRFIVLKRTSSLRLLQYFISHRENKLTKDSITSEIFPEGPIKSVNNQFHVALSHLRKALEPDLKSGRDSLFIKQAGDYFSLNLDHIDLDVHEFIQLIRQQENSSSLERMEKLKKAELLYRGDYFEEFPYVRFLEIEREKFRNYYLNLLQELARFYFDNCDFQQGIHYYEKALKEEPYEESIYMEFIRRLLEAKLPIQAKKVSERYQKLIVNELGIPVQAKLRNKVSQI
jgi:LuxR family maltose regulon positive regulatory protein